MTFSGNALRKSIDPSHARKPDEIFEVLSAGNSFQKTQKRQAKSMPPVLRGRVVEDDQLSARGQDSQHFTRDQHPRLIGAISCKARLIVTQSKDPEAERQIFSISEKVCNAQEGFCRAPPQALRVRGLFR